MKSVELGEKGHWGVLEGGLDSRVLGVRGQGILKFLIHFVSCEPRIFNTLSTVSMDLWLRTLPEKLKLYLFTCYGYNLGCIIMD